MRFFAMHPPIPQQSVIGQKGRLKGIPKRPNTAAPVESRDLNRRGPLRGSMTGREWHREEDDIGQRQINGVKDGAEPPKRAARHRQFECRTGRAHFYRVW